MEDKVEVDGRLRYCDHRMGERAQATRGEPEALPTIPSDSSSIRSFQSGTSKKLGKQKNKSTETLPGAVNRAVPGPGDEVEAEPDAGVVESEKVSVVFLVSSNNAS